MLLQLPKPFLRSHISKRFAANLTSQRPRRPGQHYRLWALPGDEIRAKEIIVRQHTMKWHPGLNVGITQNRFLYALCDGIMIITEEKFDPDWDNNLVQEIYTQDDEKNAPGYARYVHVIPKKRVPEFRLINVA